MKLDDYYREVQHSADKEGKIEKAAISAYELDGDDGLYKLLGFNDSMLSKVDYFLLNDESVSLLELTDMKDTIAECRSQSEAVLDNPAIVKAKEKQQQVKKCWSPVFNEILKKWSGSIASVERLFRLFNHNQDVKHDYEFCLVVKSNDDPRACDAFTSYLKGTIRSFTVVKTCQLGDK